MAANQGLYNGFLASGLIWSLLIENPEWSRNIAVFFLGCVFCCRIVWWIQCVRKNFYYSGNSGNPDARACFFLKSLLKKPL